MKSFLFLVLAASTVFALTNNQIKQNCCTLYDNYPKGTEITIGSISNVYNQEYKSQMTESQALTISGYCDTETHTIYSWEDPQSIEGLPSWANLQYTKVAYTYNCSSCNNTESDFPLEHEGFPKQSIEVSSEICLAKIQTYSKDSSGSAYVLSDQCPNLVGCYYNLPASTGDGGTVDNGSDSGTDNNTTPGSVEISNLSTVENKLGNIESSTLNTATAIEDLNSKFELDTTSNFANKITENANLFEESLGIISSNYETVTQSFDDLKNYVTSNPFSFININTGGSCLYDFNVFNKSIEVNMCQYNYLVAPLIIFLLNIAFMYALIRLNFYLFMLIFVSHST